jgi:hypothetical protein
MTLKRIQIIGGCYTGKSENFVGYNEIECTAVTISVEIISS